MLLIRCIGINRLGLSVFVSGAELKQRRFAAAFGAREGLSARTALARNRANRYAWAASLCGCGDALKEEVCYAEVADVGCRKPGCVDAGCSCRHRRVRLAAQAAPTAAPAPAQAAPAPPAPTPEQLAIQAASEKDHQRMMDLLGIKTCGPAPAETRIHPMRPTTTSRRPTSIPEPARSAACSKTASR